MFRIFAFLALSAVLVQGSPVMVEGPGVVQQPSALLHPVMMNTAGVGSIIPGKCPNFTTQMDFDITAYTGRWFEIQKFPTLFEYNSKCIKADYTPLTEDSIKVVNSGQRNSDGTPYDIVGNATATDVSGRFDLYFPNVPTAGSYDVLHTDYKNYTTIYSCGSLGPLSIQYAWILSRETTLSDELTDEAYKVFEGFGIDTSKFTKTVQDDTCKY